MSPEETRRALELKRYFSVLPAFRSIYHDISYDYLDIVSSQVSNPYISAEETPLSIAEIRQRLKDYDLLIPPKNPAASRYWPGDKEER